MHQAFMNFKKAIKLAGLVVTSGTLISFGATQAFAGADPAAGIGDSTSGGAIDFTPTSTETGSTITVPAGTLESGGTVSTEISPGVQAQVSSQETAVGDGVLTQNQADNGVGAAGAVINSPEAATAIDAAADATTIEILDNNNNTTVVDLEAPISNVIATLASSEALQSVSVTLPGGGTFTLGALLNNVAVALAATAADGVSLPTALNDVIIALKSADVPPGAEAEVEQAIRLIQALRDAVP